MLHLYLRVAGLSLLSFIATLLLLRSQPYDDHELRHLLLPDNCPAPCFMGIRPGVTTDTSAMQLLQSNSWVKQVQYKSGSRIIWVEWNNLATEWLVNQGKYSKSSLSVKDGLVTEVHLNTSLTLADIQLTLGESFHQWVYLLNLQGHTILNYSALYPQAGLYTNISHPCDDNTRTITYNDVVYIGYASLTYISDLPYKYDSTWADLLRTSCDRG